MLFVFFTGKAQCACRLTLPICKSTTVFYFLMLLLPEQMESISLNIRYFLTYSLLGKYWLLCSVGLCYHTLTLKTYLFKLSHSLEVPSKAFI